MDGGGGGHGCVGGVPCTHTCIHMHARMHMHVKHANHAKMDASMLAAICNFYTCIHVRMCVCVCAHVCACVGDTPHAPRCP